jgi:hypothetical protein
MVGGAMDALSDSKGGEQGLHKIRNGVTDLMLKAQMLNSDEV